MINNMFREAGIARSKKQPQMVDQILQGNNFLSTVIVQDSTDVLSNVYENLLSVTGAQIVNADGVLPTVSVSTDLEQTDLSIIGGRDEVGEDKAVKVGGFAGYFAGRQPHIFRKTGNDLSQSLLYNSLRAYAQANSKLQLLGGTTANVQNSIVAVTWMPGEVTGLMSPVGPGGGTDESTLLDTKLLHGGNLYDLQSASGVLGHGIRYKGYFGMQLANPDFVSAMANIELAGTLPTAAQIETLLENCRAEPGITILYCHPTVKSVVFNPLKATHLQMGVFDKDLDRTVDKFNNIPIVTDRNFLINGEAVVS